MLYTKHIDDIPGGPKQDSLPNLTTIQPSTLKALQTTKTTKLDLLFLTPLFFNRGATTPNEKQIHFLPSRKTIADRGIGSRTC